MSLAMTFMAAPEDIDELGHVNNAVWVQWIQEVATTHWRAVASPEHQEAYFWVITRHEVDYLRALGPGGRVTARTWVDAAGRGARFDRHVESRVPMAEFMFARARRGRSSTRRAGGRSGCRPTSSRRSCARPTV